MFFFFLSKHSKAEINLEEGGLIWSVHQIIVTSIKLALQQTLTVVRHIHPSSSEPALFTFKVVGLLGLIPAAV